HDFRVSLRRLRTTLSAHKTHLGTIRKKSRRRIASLADSTGTARDAEVQRAWLRGQREHLGARERIGLDWIMANLERRRDDAYESLRRDASKRYDRLGPQLDERLDGGRRG